MTRAFIRSLISWQSAMIAATGHPNPVALIPPGNLDEAAVSADAAEAWVQGIRDVIDGIQSTIAEAERRGDGEHPEIVKWRGVLPSVNAALHFALDHAKSFDGRGTENT